MPMNTFKIDKEKNTVIIRSVRFLQMELSFPRPPQPRKNQFQIQKEPELLSETAATLPALLQWYNERKAVERTSSGGIAI